MTAVAQAEELFRRGRLDEAADLCLSVRDNARAALLLARIRLRQGATAESVDHFTHAAALDPRSFEAFWGLGQASARLGRSAQAISAYRVAVSLRPDHAGAHNNLGVLYWEADRPADAAACFARAAACQNDYAEAFFNLGAALAGLARHREAIAAYRRATAIKPDYASAHWNQSLSLLALGEFAAAAPLAQWRWKTADFAGGRRSFAASLWLGNESLTGKTILLHAEQGLGDTIQLCRFVPAVAARGARVVLEVPAALKPLCGGLPGAALVVAAGERLPVVDYHCPLPDLPFALSVTLATIPASAPYLRAPAPAAVTFRRPGDRALVGLAWRGNPANKNDRLRSMTLATLAPLLAVPGVRFVSLQQDLSDEERAIAARAGNLVHPGADFAGTAAIVGQLDLVIAVDTSWAHWAGAIARPLWVMLRYAPDWRWLLDRDDSPWYPTAHLFRQPALADWPSVVERVRGALETFVAGPR